MMFWTHYGVPSLHAKKLRSHRNEKFGRHGRLSLPTSGQQGMFRLQDSIVRRSCGNLWYVSLDFLPALPFLTSSAAFEAYAWGTSRAKKGSKLAELRLRMFRAFSSQ